MVYLVKSHSGGTTLLLRMNNSCSERGVQSSSASCVTPQVLQSGNVNSNFRFTSDQ